MAEKVLMLALSPTMDEGTITRWHKQEGETVAHGELLCEVETDKATMDYESINEGTLLKILVPDGGGAKVGAPIAIVGKSGEDIGALLAEAQAAAAAAPAAPATAPAAAPLAGASPIASPAAAAAPPAAAPFSPSVSGLRVKASPLARRMAQENRLDLGGIPGSGPGGRVVKRDLERAMGAAAAVAGAAVRPAAGPAGMAAPARPARPPAAAAAAPITPAAQDQRIPVSGKRRIIAQRLSESKLSAPHYYLKIDVAADRLLDARRRLNSRLGPEGKVSLNAFLVKFAAETLKRHPVVNSSWQGDHILRFGRADIGLAVAQEDGLITAVVRDCGSKGILAIDRELADLVERARTNRLTPEQYSGATFTVTSLGSYGILEFSAIINPPGSAILAVGRIHRQPVVDEKDQIRVQSQMILTLSCDHRVVDGAVGAAFLYDLKAIIEDPIEALY